MVRSHKKFYDVKITHEVEILGEELSLPSSSQSGVTKFVTKRTRDGIMYEAVRAACASEWATDS